MIFRRLSRVLFICFILVLTSSFTYQAVAYFGLTGIPYIQELTSVQNTPFSTSTLNLNTYRDLTTLYGTQSSTVTNPFATYGTNTMVYSDLFSQASAQTMAYSNIFGVSLEQGQGFYRDPFYTTGGKYTNYASPAGGFSFDQSFAQTPYGGSSHVSSELILPWTYYGTEINTAYGAGAAATPFGIMPTSSYGVSTQHAAFGTPTAFNLAGLHPDVAGQLALHASSSQTAAMDRALSSQYMYTKEGMPFIAAASYYNPDSYGGSNWFFPGEISYTQTGTENVGGITSGYTLSQELSTGTGGFPVYSYGGSVGASTGFGGSVGGATTIGGGTYGGGAYGGGAIGGGSFVSGAGITYGGSTAWQ